MDVGAILPEFESQCGPGQVTEHLSESYFSYNLKITIHLF